MRESTIAVIVIALLTVIEVVFVFLFTCGFVPGWRLADTGNTFLGGILAIVFVDPAFILALYRKEFLFGAMIVEKRRHKQEDLYVCEEGVDDVTVSGDDAWEQVKCAIYPYYRQ